MSSESFGEKAITSGFTRKSALVSAVPAYFQSSATRPLAISACCRFVPTYSLIATSSQSPRAMYFPASCYGLLQLPIASRLKFSSSLPLPRLEYLSPFASSHASERLLSHSKTVRCYERSLDSRKAVESLNTADDATIVISHTQ